MTIAAAGRGQAVRRRQVTVPIPLPAPQPPTALRHLKPVEPVDHPRRRPVGVIVAEWLLSRRIVLTREPGWPGPPTEVMTPDTVSQLRLVVLRARRSLHRPVPLLAAPAVAG